MKLQVAEKRLEEMIYRQVDDIIDRIATDKIRIVFLRKQVMQNGELQYDNKRGKPRNN